MPDDERDRLVRKYRELDGGELLRLYRAPDELPEGGAALVRDELRLRGIDPVSLEATVPKAMNQADGDDEPSQGEMDPPEGFSVPPHVRRAMDAAPEAITAARDIPDLKPATENGTIASATIGLIGVAALVFAGYVVLTTAEASAIAGIAGGLGLIALSVSVILYRKSRVEVR